MSKLSTLKHDAYQAGKKKNWVQAIMFYEQILELDKNNPTVMNELGDLCLKSDDAQRAISFFLSAAAKYRSTGLLNNAVAIYKKILRHEADNLNAHWYLSETRVDQGLTAEGEFHALRFLSSSEAVPSDIKEIFLKRCKDLFEMYPESGAVLAQLSQVFRLWNLPLEGARVECLLACIGFKEGAEAAARTSIDELTAKVSEVLKYPEFAQWNALANPTAAAPASEVFNHFGDMDLNGDRPVEPEVKSLDVVPLAVDPAAETSFADVALDARCGTDGCFSLDDSLGGGSLDDLLAEAAGDLLPPEPALEIFTDPAPDLLTQFLEQDVQQPNAGNTAEVDTIAGEIGNVVGGGEDDDADRLYEMGTVYLEMGLFDQACESFEAAARVPEFCARAYEMWGVTLQRAGRLGEAIDVLAAGLGATAAGTREQHGLLYHLGQAQEQAGDRDAALKYFGLINEMDPEYLDVGRRLAKLTAVSEPCR